jgi:hypothetical protein
MGRIEVRGSQGKQLLSSSSGSAHLYIVQRWARIAIYDCRSRTEALPAFQRLGSGKSLRHQSLRKVRNTLLCSWGTGQKIVQ